MPLFATVDDRDLALSRNDTFSSPEAVLSARDSSDNSRSTEDINIIWMPRDTPRFVMDNGCVVENVIGSGLVDIRSGPPKLVFTSDPENVSGTDVAPHDVVVHISPNMSSDEIARRALEAAGRLPNHESYVHEYQPLEPTTRDIRLVKLWPGEGITQIRCETIHAWLDEKLIYEALSYTWGDPRSHGMIDLNGRPFSTRKNLEVALLHLRLKDKPRILWIDALCIDQINIKERNFQVGRMRDIYRGASKVLVFLGSASNDSDMAMDLITGDIDAGCDEAEVPQAFEYFEHDEETEMSQKNVPDAAAIGTISTNRPSDVEIDTHSIVIRGNGNKHQIDKAVQHGSGPAAESQIVEDAEDGEAECPQPFEYYSEEDEARNTKVSGYSSKLAKKRAWVALDMLIRRPWWTRIWVLQEVVVSEAEPLLICGDRSVDWREFQDFITTQGALPSLTVGFTEDRISSKQRAAISMNYRTASFFSVRKRLRKAAPVLKIDYLLRSTLNLDATEPRDKVFALVGLTSEEDSRTLAPDYSKSMAQVYAETAKHIINSTGRLDILSFNTNSEIANEKLPSWVPDWRLRASRPAPLYSHGIYWASGSFPACLYPTDPNASDTINSLTLGGMLVDKVSFCSDVFKAEWLSSNHLPELKRWIRKLEDLILKSICFLKSRLPVIPTNVEEQAALRRIFALDPDPRNSDQLWRTLVTDRTLMNEAPAPAIYAEMFEMLFFQSSDAPPRRILDEGLKSRFGYPRLQTPQPSRIPTNYCPGLPSAERMARYTAPLVTSMGRLTSRVLFITEAGRMGVAPEGVFPGDMVTILMGGDMPFVLRDHRKGNPLQLIGESYVYGLMKGEAVEAIPNEEQIEKYMLFFTLG